MVADGVSLQPDGMTFSTNAQYAIPDAGHISGDAGTISFSIQPQWDGSDGSNASLVQLSTPNVWENRIEIGKSGDILRFMFFPDSGVESGVGAQISNWQAGDWHQVTTTWGPDANGVNMLALYVDGNLIGSQPYDGQLQVPSGQPLYIGSNYTGGTAANGAISNFQVYNRALAPSEIATGAAVSGH